MVIDNIIGKVAIRRSLLLRNENTKSYYLLLGIVDVVEPDMQDYPRNEREVICERSHESSGNNPYNLYYTEEVITVKEDFLKDTENAYVIESKVNFEYIKMFSSDGFQLYPASSNSFLPNFEDENNFLKNFLPKRDCGFGLHILRGNSAPLEKLLRETSYLIKQLLELSCRFLHTDIGRYTNVLGNIYIVHYDPEFRNVDWRVCPTLRGLLGKMKYRKEGAERYKCVAINSDKNGLILESNEIEFQTGERLVFIPFHSEIDQIAIVIRNTKGQIVYTKNKMSFIKRINVGINVNSVNIALKRKEENGNETTELIPKYSGIQSVIGSKKVQDSSVVTDTKSFEQAEKELRFIFFDGDKDRKEDNLKRAHDILMKIQNTAYRRIIICDPYFEAKELYRYVFHQNSLDINTWILTSKNINKSQAQALKEAQDKYNLLTENANVLCRVMRGRSDLHDRFLIVDDRAWILGTSLNNFGERATTIALVPEDSSAKIISKIEAWWFNNSITEDLGSYAAN